MENRFSPVASGGRVARRQRRMQQIVERIERLLVPAQIIRRDRVAAGQRLIEIVAAVDVDAEVFALAADDLEHRLDALDVVFERHAADLHLHA